jgi:hypothetical protein
MKSDATKNLKKYRIYFFTLTGPGYSRSWNYFVGLRDIGIDVVFVRLDRKKLIRSIFKFRKIITEQDIHVIMSPSHILVPIVRILLGKKPYLDAGWSLFEGSVISRKNLGFLGTNVVKSYLIDFIASRFAQKIVLESHLQKNFYSSLFLVNKKKCYKKHKGKGRCLWVWNRFRRKRSRKSWGDYAVAMQAEGGGGERDKNRWQTHWRADRARRKARAGTAGWAAQSSAGRPWR